MLLPTLFIFIIPYYSSIEQFFLQWYNSVYNRGQKGTPMEIRVLQYFLTTAREENITRAARLLHLTQPTLSRQLMRLEEELGVKLFHRGKHHITLTDEGMLLRRRAEEIISLSEKTKEDLSNIHKQLEGKISIGCGEYKNSQFIGELIADFRLENPMVTFELFSGTADDIKERIENGTLDMGLLQEPVDISKYDFIRTPFREEWGVIVSEDSPLAPKEKITPLDLADTPLILPQRSLLRDELQSWFGALADRMEVAATGNLLYNMAVLARNHVGCIITLRMDSCYPGLKFIPVSPPISSGIVLVWKKAQFFSRPATAFIQLAKKYISCMISD